MTAVQVEKTRVYKGVVAGSNNDKLGENAFTSYRPVGVTCPSDCRFLNNGCYAQKSYTNITQRQSPYSAETFDANMVQVTDKHFSNGNTPSIVRWHTSGDIMLNGVIQHDYVDMLIKWTAYFRNMQVAIINFTHAWKMAGAERVKSFTRASVHTVADAVNAVRDGWYVALACDAKDAERIKSELRQHDLVGVACANQITNKRIKCADCKLCVTSGSTKRVIMFMEH